MTRPVFIAAVLFYPFPAWAGCANYTDGSLPDPAPRVTICIDGKCGKTTLDFECGTATSAQIGYANGLRLEFSGGTNLVTLAGRILTAGEIAKITCEPVENCAGFPIY